jgi:hypothetical protein
VDGDTGQPIGGAEIEVSYPLASSAVAPWPSDGKTAADGVAHVRAAPYGDIGIHVAATADGYIAEGKTLSVDNVEAIQPAHFFEAVDKRAPNLVMRLYHEPAPNVELVVPSMFHGKVKAEVRIQEDAPWLAGQREFRFDVPPSGVVQVAGPPLLAHAVPAQFQFKYADGAPLSWAAKESESGYWWLRTEGKYDLFFVGTRAEFALQSRDLPGDVKARSASQASGRGQGGGKGRRSRGGDTAPTDSGLGP